MAEAHVKNHDYHIIPPSPWPALASIGVFIMALGGIGLMRWLKDADLTLFGANLAGWGLFVIGLLVVLYTMYAWWSDTIAESRSGAHTPVVMLHLRYGMLLFIASEVMFFVAWFWAFFDASLFVGEKINFERAAVTGGVWPPKGIEAIDPWHLPLLNTLILLLSGTTLSWAYYALLHNDRKNLWNGLALTIGLGVLFLLLQIVEIAEAQFAFAGNIYGATFFMATGFHGFHVFVGVLFLTVCLLRVRAGHFTPQKHFGFEAAAWYWQFVDAVWLFLFVIIYVWGNGGSGGH